MLSYAFQVLNEQGYKQVATEEFDNVAELCAAILIKGVSLQIKRGLGKEYSGNLYQIFTYVKNLDTSNSGNVAGMLLYAKTDEIVLPNNDYKMGGNQISVKTLDLDCEFAEIKRQLDDIVQGYFGCS